MKFQMGLVVVEKEVADEVETQLGSGQSDHGPLTSPVLRTASCDLYELCRSWIPTRSGEESLSCGGGRIIVVVVAVSIAVVVAGCKHRCNIGDRV
ncbi:hypothetical protein Tco_0489237 [Tanacetum coccineum]